MPATRLKIFISSVQKEFEDTRRDLKAFLRGDAVLRRFISDVFLFEELSATDRRSDEVYLEEVRNCDVFLGILGYEYGFEDDDGISPTEHEYNLASEIERVRLIYVWGKDEKKRHPKMKALIRKASKELIRRRVEDVNALTSEVYASIVDYLDAIGVLRVPPFDTAPCASANLQVLSTKRVAWFLETSRRERKFPLKSNTKTRALLSHLNLLDNGVPTNASVLLFGSNPQKFHRTAETKCVHCHGTEYRRPFASMQVYGGDLYEQADNASDFVLSKINRSIGTRSQSNVAPASYELPPDAVSEAIINAIAHRDYNSNASVEVRLFADRLEIWNPGSLPGTLTMDDLHKDHPSVPNNPLIAEPLYLARYIERAGSGTQTIIELCLTAGLPEPTFEQRAGSFVVTLWRDWITDQVMDELGLNDRQKKALAMVKSSGSIGNSQYRQIANVSESTALRELRQLAKLGVLEKTGKTGRTTQYRIATVKPVINPSNPSGKAGKQTRHKPVKPAKKPKKNVSKRDRRNQD